MAFFWPRKGIKRGWIYLLMRMLRLRSTDYALAAGFASGVFASFTPLIGAHILISCAVAWLIRGNMLMSVIGTAVGNPWTFPLIWALIYSVGSLIIGVDPVLQDVSGVTYTTFLEAPGTVFISMIVGGVVTGSCFGLVAFLLGYGFAPQIRKQLQRIKDERLGRLRLRRKTNG
ncbi:MAG: DUF2062 domain-containing protein [Candidatus Puniceispirillales bacterium]